MYLRDLRTFVGIAEARSLSRAAARLRVAQPALSRQIRELERDLGVPLLDRHSKGVVPTLAGEAFARGAAGVLAALGFALERSRATAQGQRGRVILGAMLTVIAAGVPAAVEDVLRREDPEITLVVQDLDPPDVLEQLQVGTIDVALAMATPEVVGLVAEPLWDEHLDHVILSLGHPLASHRRLRIADLGEYPLVIPQRALSAASLDQIMVALRRGGLRSPLLVIDAGLRDGHLAVSAGRGWSLIGRARSVSPPQGTAVVPLADGAPVVRAAALWRREERRPVVRRVLQRIFDVVRARPDSLVGREPRLPPAPHPSAPGQALPGGVPPVIEIRHLRALLEVAASQTIGRAAERLGVTQPALSRQLRELEVAVGVPLLERSARGVLLTPAGSSLAGECPGLLTALEQIVLDTTRARRGMEGHCAIGAVATAATGELLTAVLADCAARHPHVHIAIEEVATPLQARAIVRGDIDLGLAHAYPGAVYADLIAEPVHHDRLQTVLLAPGHPLARRRRVKPAELAHEPFLFMARSFHPAFYDRVLDRLQDLGLTPRIEGTYDGLQAVWAMVAHGKGWCLGFRSHRRRPPAGTVAMPLVGFDLPWGLNLLRRRAEPSLTVRSVLESFRRMARGAGGSARRQGVRGSRIRTDT